MIELKISAERPEEFYLVATKTLALLLQTPPALCPLEPTADNADVLKRAYAEKAAARDEASFGRERTVLEAEPLENPKASDPPPELAEAKKRGRKRAETVEVLKTDNAAQSAAKAANEKLDDPIPDFLDKKKQAFEHTIELEYTVEDIQSRTKAIVDACKERGQDMSFAVPYVMQLFGVFKIKKAAELAADRFAEFMDKSTAYVDGTANLEGKS